METLCQFVAEGAHVAITTRNSEAFEPVRRESKDAVHCIASDAGDATGQKRLAEIVEEKFAGLDVLFINAGVADLRPVDQWDEAAWDHCFHTDVRGLFFLDTGPAAAFREPCLRRSQCLHQCPHRRAEHQRVRSPQGDSTPACPHTL